VILCPLVDAVHKKLGHFIGLLDVGSGSSVN
jgi:hypothetical protein